GFTVGGTGTQTPSGELGIALEDHSDGSVTITITGQVPASHLFYVTVHLDYGLKGSVGYGKNYNDDAIDPDTLEVLIPNYGQYVFSVSGDMSDTQVVENENTFKRNPGFGGIVTDGFGTPIEGYTVKVYDSDGNLIGSAVTDEDGYYFIYYKHKGKREMFKVAVFENAGDLEPLAEQTVELKANKFVEVNFVL
ncbi:MAG: carboxypeptidase-like regulatory domain-containing protein, partial [Candidatus Thorarchaeota archaeon]